MHLCKLRQSPCARVTSGHSCVIMRARSSLGRSAGRFEGIQSMKRTCIAAILFCLSSLVLFCLSSSVLFDREILSWLPLTITTEIFEFVTFRNSLPGLPTSLIPIVKFPWFIETLEAELFKDQSSAMSNIIVILFRARTWISASGLSCISRSISSL